MFTFRSIFLGFAALMVCTPFIYFGGLYAPLISSRLILLSIAAIGLIVISFVRAQRDHEFLSKLIQGAMHPMSLAFFVFLLWLTIRSLAAGSYEFWWGSLTRTDGIFFWALWLLCVVLFSTWFRAGSGNKKIIEHLSTIFVVVGIGLTLLTGIAALFQSVFNHVDVRFAGSVGNPLYLAGVLLFIPWASLSLKNLYARWIVISIAVIALIATEARTALLAVVIGVAAYIFFRSDVSRWVRGALITIVLVAGVLTTIAVTSGYAERVVTVQTRLALWKSGAHELLKHPLIGYGIGPHLGAIDRGTAALKQVSFSEISDATHSAYLDIALMGGAVALLLLAGWLVLLLRTVWLSDAWRTPSERSLAFATSAAYLAFVTTSFFSIWHLLPLALLVAVALQPRVGVVANKSSRVVFILIGIVGVLVTFSAVILVINTAYAARYVHRVELAMQRRQHTELPSAPLKQYQWTPFARDFLTAQLRLSLSTAELGVKPSFEKYAQHAALPAAQQLLAWEGVHPQQDHVLASWLLSYVSSGLTPDHTYWLGAAVRAEERALTISCDRPQSVFLLADLYRQSGRMDDALAALKELSDRHPNFAEAHLFYGMMLDIADKKDLARVQGSRALELRPLDLWEQSHQEWLQIITNEQ
ncbi:MAG: hypothetical protein A3C15_04300 [Candidatus Magasanikbacteria bacterium RIFCSPHIGHO2_02_FULL_50_9b]|uniref:O-antigen ligase-related domain-containing protein n=1 Tax=Candidatus Magasanikbacteria bacterium RIFCSPHIGHO2_02_FULL_50_9b TaxID=1798682 RepID=A0A1F6M869_9BACT|nr:MAG: hypothetical protein A3C15_04300 [Candidatus Magasanikbacteria bacterium RIFCSPHIGHO2_02_FULL_50_9b]